VSIVILAWHLITPSQTDSKLNTVT